MKVQEENRSQWKEMQSEIAKLKDQMNMYNSLKTTYYTKLKTTVIYKW